MRNRIILFALFLLLSILKKKASAREEGSRLFSNFFFEEAIDEAQCDQLEMDVSALDSMTSVDTIPKIVGHWVSQGCEVRPGPEFVLRSYTFTESSSFRLVQHYYEDEDCVSPTYSVVAKGKLTLKKPYWVTRIGMESEFSLSKMTIIPHISEYIEKFSSELKHKCSGRERKIWKPHKEYVIYAKYEEVKSRKKLKRFKSKEQIKAKRKKSHGHIDCLNAVKLNFGELMLIRAQTKVVDETKSIRELFLGNIPYHWQTHHKPTAFQSPLLLSEEVPDCFNCQIIAKGTKWSPPQLFPKVQLPPLPDGQWISQRCEVRPVGVFLKRKFSFDSRDYSWTGAFKFYEDPFCTEPTFTISASGKYKIGSDEEKENSFGRRKTGTNFDVLTRGASLTIYDPILRDMFNVETNCGVGPWRLGVSKDLSTTSGCSTLDITLPSTDYDLIKMELDTKGTPMLLLGLQDSELKNKSRVNRPTAFQAPLIQCSVFPHQNSDNHHFAPISYFKITSRSSSIIFSFPALCTMPLLILLFSYFFYKKL